MVSSPPHNPDHHLPGNQPPLPFAFAPEPSIPCPLPSWDMVLAFLMGPKPDFSYRDLTVWEVAVCLPS